jgi:hypothetical protein
MAIVAPWMHQYGVALRSDVNLANKTTVDGTEVSVSDAGVFTAEGAKLFVPAAETGHYGIPTASWLQTTDVYGVPVTNRPSFDPGQEINEYDKAIGESIPTAGTGYNFSKGILGPTTEYEFDVDQSTIIPFLLALFQAGSSFTSFDVTTPADTDDHCDCLFQFPSSSDGAAVSYYLELFKTMDHPNGQVLSDAICTRMTLTGATNEPLHATFEMMGRQYSTHDLTDISGIDSSGSSIVSYAEVNPLLWQNAIVCVGNVDSSGTVTNHEVCEADGFELTITANIVARRYNSRSPLRYVINGYTLEGNIKIPYSAETIGGSYFQDHVTRNTTEIHPIPVDLFWLNGTIGTAYSSLALTTPGTNISTAQMTTLRNMQADDGTATDNVCYHTDRDMHIGVGAVPRSAPDEGDEETMLTLNFSGANIRSGNTITQRAMRISWLEGANVANDCKNYLTRPTP